MNRLAPAILVLALAVSACASPISGPNAVATWQSFAATVAAQTLAAEPTRTPLPTNTALPTATATITATNAPSATPTSAMTATVTGTITTGTATVTGTLTPLTPTATFTKTPAATNTGTVTPATATPTNGVLLYGTQPPYIHYGHVKLINKAKADVYVSFQCTTPEGYFSIVEYPVGGTITVAVPAGRCQYVAWVGGREFVGQFGLGRFDELTMTFMKDSVTIK